MTHFPPMNLFIQHICECLVSFKTVCVGNITGALLPCKCYRTGRKQMILMETHKYKIMNCGKCFGGNPKSAVRGNKTERVVRGGLAEEVTIKPNSALDSALRRN